MKIDSLTPLTPAGAGTGKPGRPVAGADTPLPAGPGVSRLRPDGQYSDQDINPARVEEIRRAIADGQLPIRTGEIADALIRSVQDLLKPTDA